MPALVCSAQHCVYNNAMYCSKGDILVGGENAKECQDTCCESFQERRQESARSSMQVDISGAAACKCEETECVTFDDKNS